VTIRLRRIEVLEDIVASLADINTQLDALTTLVTQIVAQEAAEVPPSVSQPAIDAAASKLGVLTSQVQTLVDASAAAQAPAPTPVIEPVVTQTSPSTSEVVTVPASTDVASTPPIA
jgi:hypothetical protein